MNAEKGVETSSSQSLPAAQCRHYRLLYMRMTINIRRALKVVMMVLQFQNSELTFIYFSEFEYLFLPAYFHYFFSMHTFRGEVH